MSSIETLLKGIIVPLVTPLVEPDVLDVKHLHVLIDHVIGKRVKGIFILGTTGEVADLNQTICQQVIEETCKHVRQRATVLVGVSSPLPEALAIAGIAAENGADGLVLPFPFFPIPQKDLFEYTDRFAQRSSLPVCLYNKPNRTKTVFEIETVKRLFDIENIIGIKDSSGGRDYFRELIQLKTIRPGWFVLAGLEQFLAEAIREGADGGVPGGGNLFPGLYVDLYLAAVQKRTSDVQRLHKIVEDIVDNIYQPEYLAGLKYALSCKQLCREIPANPIHIVGSAQKKRIEQFLQNINIPGQ